MADPYMRLAQALASRDPRKGYPDGGPAGENAGDEDAEGGEVDYDGSLDQILNMMDRKRNARGAAGPASGRNVNDKLDERLARMLVGGAGGDADMERRYGGSEGRMVKQDERGRPVPILDPRWSKPGNKWTGD